MIFYYYYIVSSIFIIVFFQITNYLISWFICRYIIDIFDSTMVEDISVDLDYRAMIKEMCDTGKGDIQYDDFIDDDDDDEKENDYDYYDNMDNNNEGN